MILDAVAVVGVAVAEEEPIAASSSYPPTSWVSDYTLSSC